MNAKLSTDLTKAIDAHAGQPIKVEHPGTHEFYVIVDSDTHERAMRALREKEDLAAIQAGIDDMEAGRVTPVAEADSKMRERLGFPSKEN